MKKALNIFALTLGLACFASASAYAVPAVNGTLGAGEWDNTGYNYYLQISDPNELGIPDAYDIKSVTILQELEFGGFGDANAANDGIYILIETYADPSMVDALAGSPRPTISMNGDFDGNGTIDIEVVHSISAGLVQSVEVTNFLVPVSGDLVGAGGAFAATGPGITVLEYFIPTGAFGTPAFPFPQSFIGGITYDNGGNEPDDSVSGSAALVPEPSSMLLFGGALLGILGIRSRKKK
jgi:hypothetical protein